MPQALSVAIIGGIGVVLAGFELWHLTQMQTVPGQLLEAGLPLGMALFIISASGWLYRSEFTESETLRITGWFIAGLLGMALVTGWIISHQIIRGVDFHHWHFVTASSMASGGMAGFLIGVYDGKRRVHHRAAERAQQAISASMDGIATLDENGVYESVNQSHATIYGYDDTDPFVGETWHMCYTEADAVRVAEEIMPQLRADGSWRGELIGRRRDGTTFPQELTLSLRPDGGLICVVRDVTERHKREQGLRALHDATREIMQATDRASICRIGVDAAQHALGLPMSAVWLRAADARRLEPVALSDRAKELFDEQPTFTPGNSIAWRVHESGDPHVFDDVSTEPDSFNPETKLRGELLVPIGEYGVLASGSTDPGRFDETDVVLAQLLAANMRTAFDRADGEADLQRQTDQMEFFNSILRHDVLNGMTVIRGRAEFLTDELEGEQLRDAQTIIDWSNDIVAIVQRVRRVLDTLTGTGDPQLDGVELSAVLRAEVDRVQATYPDVTFETAIPGTVHVQAND